MGWVEMSRIWFAIVAVLFVTLASGCFDGGGQFERELTRTLVVSDAYSPEYRSRIRLDQSVVGSNGSVQVTFINDTGACVWPYWNLRLTIGAVDRTVSGVSQQAIAPYTEAQIGSFAFVPSVELANILYYTEFWYFRC